MHLQVGDIPAADDFYHGVLGFDVMASMPSALFLSAGGYHHHLGVNTWQSRGAPRPPADAAGLTQFTIALPDAGRTGSRLGAARRGGCGVPAS